MESENGNAPDSEESGALVSSQGRGFSVFVAVGVAVVLLATDAFGTADDHLAAHEFLVVEFVHGATSLVDAAHFEESVTFGPLGVLMAHDFGELNGPDSAEEFLEVVLAGVVGKIADVKALAGHLDIFGGTAGFGLPSLPGLPRGAFPGLAGFATFRAFARPRSTAGRPGFGPGAGFRDTGATHAGEGIGSGGALLFRFGVVPHTKDAKDLLEEGFLRSAARNLFLRVAAS
jgi:hypothetical protein